MLPLSASWFISYSSFFFEYGCIRQELNIGGFIFCFFPTVHDIMSIFYAIESSL